VSNCTSCISGYVLSGSTCSSSCGNGQYLVSGTSTCAPCTGLCANCSGDATTCNSCTADNLYYSNNCYAPSACPNGTVAQSGNGICAPCQSPCASCSSTVDSCTACIAGYYYDATTSSCVTTCPAGTAPTGSSCTACQSPCANCSSTTMTCTGCIEGASLYQSSCYAPEDCPAGTVSIGSSCESCESACATCNGTTSVCTSCPTDQYLYNDDCYTSCPAAGTFVSGSTCAPCDPSCSSCVGSATTCTACNTTSATPILYGSTCSATCPVGTYVDAGLFQCLSCTSPCSACTSASTAACTACIHGMFLSQSQCVYQCPAQTYPDYTSGTCAACDPSCANCTSGSASDCTACPLGGILSGGQCLTQGCPTGSVAISGTCVACTAPCTACANASTTACTACTDSDVLFGAACFGSCPAGTALSGPSTCAPCDAPCSTCTATGTNIGTCSSCVGGYFLFNQTCYDATCPAGTFVSGADCAVCADPCSTCVGSGTTCTACLDGKVLLGSTCVDSCPDGTYLSGSPAQCLSCTSPCATCNTTATLCSTCVNGYSLYDGACYAACPSNTLSSSIGDVDSCTDCDWPCASCQTTTSTCTACLDALVLLPDNNGSCAATCPGGSFSVDDGPCATCSSPCATCTGTASNCTSCLAGQGYLYADAAQGDTAGSCYTVCPSGTIANTTSLTCVPCTNDCATCLAPNTATCASCTSGAFLVNATCVAACPAGFLQSGSSCLPCSLECAACQGLPTSCTSCPAGSVLYGSTCLATCPSGTYAANGNTVCASCSFPCAACSGQPTTCTSCFQGQYLYQQSCFYQCPVRTAPNGTICSPVEAPCTSTTVDNAVFGAADPDTVVTGNCTLGFLGTASGYCTYDGTWDDTQFNVSCLFEDLLTGGRIGGLLLTYIDASSAILDWSLAPGLNASQAPHLFAVLLSTDGVSFSQATTFNTGPITAPPVEIGSLTQDTHYYFQVFGAISVLQHDATGAQLQATTAILPPQGLVVSNLNDTSLTVAWMPALDSLAQYYFISIRASASSKRASSGGYTVLAVIPAVDSPAYNITGLNASTAYTIWVQASLDTSHPEPVGVVAVVVTTASPAVAASQGGLPLAALIAIIVVVLVLLCILVGVCMWKRHRHAQEQRKILLEFAITGDAMMSMAPINPKATTNVSVIPDEVAIGYAGSKGHSAPGTRTMMYRQGQGDATLINTVLEVALPGFLKLDYNTDIRTENKLTAGGAGQVFKGVILDNQLAVRYGDRTVAVKHLMDYPGQDEEDIDDRFHQEVAIMWSLSFHPNVVKIVGYTDKPQPRTIVSPLYKTDLFRYLHSEDAVRTPLATDVVLHLCQGMMAALDAIHAMGVAHRDIKSPNVLLAEPLAGGSPYPVPVLCDFGLSRTSDEGSVKKSVIVLGLSPRYAAPEVFARMQLRSASWTVDDDKRSDVFAMGVTFWETMRRQMPWTGVGNDEVEMRVRSGQALQPLVPNDKDPIERLVAAIANAAMDLSASRRPTAASCHAQLTDLLLQVSASTTRVSTLSSSSGSTATTVPTGSMSPPFGSLPATPQLTRMVMPPLPPTPRSAANSSGTSGSRNPMINQ